MSRISALRMQMSDWRLGWVHPINLLIEKCLHMVLMQCMCEELNADLLLSTLNMTKERTTGGNQRSSKRQKWATSQSKHLRVCSVNGHRCWSRLKAVYNPSPPQKAPTCLTFLSCVSKAAQSEPQMFAAAPYPLSLQPPYLPRCHTFAVEEKNVSGEEHEVSADASLRRSTTVPLCSLWNIHPSNNPKKRTCKQQWQCFYPSNNSKKITCKQHWQCFHPSNKSKKRTCNNRDSVSLTFIVLLGARNIGQAKICSTP
jgi:hypothetical protein